MERPSLRPTGDMTDFPSWERYVAFLCGMYGAFRAYKARSKLASLAALLSFGQLFVVRPTSSGTTPKRDLRVSAALRAGCSCQLSTAPPRSNG